MLQNAQGVTIDPNTSLPLPFAYGNRNQSRTPFSVTTTTPITNTSQLQLLPAPGAGLRYYVQSMVVGNDHSTNDTEVTIQDGSTAWVKEPAVHLGGGFSISVEKRQPTDNQAINVICSVAANVLVTLSGYIAP